MFGCTTKQNDNKETIKAPWLEKTNKIDSIQQIAHSLGCITMDELEDLVTTEFSYLFEKRLPLRVYVDDLEVEDIVSTIEDSRVVFNPEIELEICLSAYVDLKDNTLDADYIDGNYNHSWGDVSSWFGVPSQRESECWLLCKSWPVSCYVGVDKSKSDWLLDMAKKSERYELEINEPMILEVYQFRHSGDGVKIKADLLEVIK